MNSQTQILPCREARSDRRCSCETPGRNPEKLSNIFLERAVGEGLSSAPRSQAVQVPAPKGNTDLQSPSSLCPCPQTHV